MSAVVHVVCPGCAALNRVPRERTGAAPSCGRCHTPLFRGEPLPLDSRSFEQHSTKGELPLLVDFWAPWCAPCHMMAPEFARASRNLEPAFRLAKVDTQAEPALAARFAIRSIPTMILFQAGREIARRSGSISATEIERWARSVAAR